jgi:hypothetical protein
MTTNTSPDRGSLQLDAEFKRVESGEKTLEQAHAMIEFHQSWHARKLALESTDEWKKDNMEYDLRSTQWIIQKVKSSEVYAQNLYAAMCNNAFTKNDVIPILVEQRWSCSWRHAGGIIADMLEKGDYIDWYCSGIRGNEDVTDEQFQQMTKEQQDYYIQLKSYVPESTITNEIKEDLLALGWIVTTDDIEY